MSKLEKLKEKARSLEAKDPKAAIDTWLEALQVQEDEGNPNADLSAYNRIGDLYLKLKDPAQAADYYERAVDKYAELGFHNNAIALCNKVLRNAPGRHTPYLKLAKLYASKGFYAEAKQNLVEYAGRLQKAGKTEQAFAALKELADLSPDSSELQDLLQEHHKLYGSPGPSTRAPAADSAPKKEDQHKSGKRKSSSLVFLDLDEPVKPKFKPARSSPPVEPIEPAASLPPEESPEPDTSLEIETTSLSSADESDAPAPTVEGLERTIDFGDIQPAIPDMPLINEAIPSTGIEPLPDFEPTVDDDDVEMETGAGEEDADEHMPREKVGPFARTGRPGPPSFQPAQPVVPRRPGSAVPPAATGDALGRPKKNVEVPPLELEPDFETGITAQSHEVDDEPLVDLGVEGIVNQGDEHGGAVLFGNLVEEQESATATPIEDLEARVADDPDDPDAHRALGEALIESGERERGIEELDHATAGFENHGDLSQAQGMVEEVLRLDPNSVRHRQKLVEYAFKSGDKPRLIEAYLELADTLLRSDLPDKARAVYQRVSEHEPGNARAKAALGMFAPMAPPPPAPKRPEREGRVAPKDAKMKVRDEADVDGTDFVDLGAIILEEDGALRDTRMKVADEEPSGDEEKDFHEMLARFRQGIEENIEETDFQSHYDLGVAFKEMGLLDEAIAEFQKALRAPDGKLKTSEALGICFCEKKAFVVAETILRRGLDFPAASETERLGVLYWLARALEAQGKKPEAKEFYSRVFAIDIRFADVGARVKALAKLK